MELEQKFEFLAQLLQEEQIPFVRNELMSNHTTFLLGGPAAVFLEPRNEDEIIRAASCCRHAAVPVFYLGRGSNLLVEDGSLSLAVFHLGESFSQVEQTGESELTAQSGALLIKVCRAAAEKGLGGLEFAYGIPGSVGGGVYMNAGAYGGELQQVVTSVRYLDEQGTLCEAVGEELSFGYRHSLFTNRSCLILSAVFSLKPDAPDAIRTRMEDYMGRRRSKQPLEFGSAGSTFKRPVGAYASALIDQCGLKGYTVGNAQVSEKHAGFVINRGGASCKQVKAVMSHVIKTVEEQTGFHLEPEIRMLP